MRFHLQLSYHYHQFFVFYVAQSNDFYEKPYNLLKIIIKTNVVITTFLNTQNKQSTKKTTSQTKKGAIFSSTLIFYNHFNLYLFCLIHSKRFCLPAGTSSVVLGIKFISILVPSIEIFKNDRV